MIECRAPAEGDPVRTIMEILGEAKKLAREYYAVTKKPLGVTGEVAEYEAGSIFRIFYRFL